MIELSIMDCISIVQMALGLLPPYNDFSRRAKHKILLAKEVSEQIQIAKNPRDEMNRVLTYLIEAHSLQEKSIFTWPLWDGDYISVTVQEKKKVLNKLCISIAYFYNRLHEEEIAKNWLLKMDVRGEYDKSSIPIFKEILKDDYDIFKIHYLDVSDNYIKNLEETREKLRNREIFFFRRF